MNDAPGKVHTELRGRQRLHNLVNCLGNSCPWTATVKSSDMLAYLGSEVHELQEEISFLKSKGDRIDSSLSGNDLSSFHKKKEMIAELGDILFDALMLEMLLRREHNFGVDEAWQVASEKVERRTPYMQEWGDGKSIAKTVEEAEQIWQAVKKQEKAEKLAGVKPETLNAASVGHANTSLGSNAACTQIKRHSNLLVSVLLGFATGVIFCGGKRSK